MSSPWRAFSNFKIVFFTAYKHCNFTGFVLWYCQRDWAFFSWVPNYPESVRVNIGFPVVRVDGRSFGRCTVRWNFLGRFAYPWCSTGPSESSAIIKVKYLIHCLEWKQVDIAILHRKLGYSLNLDLCCVTRECLLFLSYIWLVRDLGVDRSIFRYICACHFCVNSPALCTLFAKPCKFPLRTLIYMVACVLWWL